MKENKKTQIEMKTLMCEMKIYLVKLVADQTSAEEKITELEDSRNSPKLKKKKGNKRKSISELKNNFKQQNIYVIGELKEEEGIEKVIEKIRGKISDSLKTINLCIKKFQQFLSTRNMKKIH